MTDPDDAEDFEPHDPEEWDEAQSGDPVTAEAWNALRLIRDALEELGPPGTIRSGEAVLQTLGPELKHEAQAIVEGIQRLAEAAQRGQGGRG